MILFFAPFGFCLKKAGFMFFFQVVRLTIDGGIIKISLRSKKSKIFYCHELGGVLENADD